MKKMKRYAALVAASALVLSPISPAKAEEEAQECCSSIKQS